MVLCTALWSTAGVATRLLDHAHGYEIAFWRSLVCAIFVICVLAATHRGRWITEVRASGWPGLVSGIMWSVMFTCFMVALTRTTVANVLVVMAAAPLLAALLGMAVLRESVPLRNGDVIELAGTQMQFIYR
jgi:drug/metabolite transporter (DMT)-like permease